MERTDDARIIQQVLGGDTHAFAELLERYETKVYGLVVRIVGVEAEAEELTQDVFLQAYNHLGDFRAEADFPTWLYRIAYNTAVSHLRRRHMQTLPMNEQLADSVVDEIASSALSESTEERLALLEEALKHLSPEDRTAITLFYLEDRPTREIAYVLGTSVTGVTSRLHRARKRLRRLALGGGLMVAVVLVFSLFLVVSRVREARMLARYEGSYIIENGQRTDDLRAIQTDIDVALAMADAAENNAPQTDLVREVEQAMLNATDDPELQAIIQQMLNE